MTNISNEIEAIAPELTELDQLNLKVAAIAGWENVEPWNLKLPKRVYVGTNKKHPDLGIFVPDYTSNLNVIYGLFVELGITVQLVHDAQDFTHFAVSVLRSGGMWQSPAIALCKLLLELAPNLPKSEPEVQVIDDDGEIDEPTVIEATFG